MEKTAVNKILRPDASVKILSNNEGPNFSVDHQTCTSLFEFNLDTDDPSSIGILEHIAGRFKIAFHALSYGVTREFELAKMDEIDFTFKNGLVNFHCDGSRKVGHLGQNDSKGLIPHHLPWRIGHLFLIFRNMLHVTGHTLEGIIGLGTAIQEVFQLDREPNAVDIRNAFCQMSNQIFGITNVDNNDVCEQTGHTVATHRHFYTTGLSFTSNVDKWHRGFGEIKRKRGVSDSVTPKECLQALRLLKNDSQAVFRDGDQIAMIEAICKNKDFISLMPPGSGKSLAFKLPALAAQLTGTFFGCTFVIVSITFLSMHHAKESACIQVTILKASDLKGPGKTPAPFSGGFPSLVFMTVDTFEKLMSQCLDFLKLSIANGLIGRIVIDEAHEIITQYDFRQVFGCLSEIRTKLPYIP